MNDYNGEFLPKILPKVFRTEGDMVDYDPNKIFISLIKETRMEEMDANKITELVTRRIISSGIKFLSGPHIREIVCSILSEQHYEKERKLYTRIGMPLMDYEDMLENPPRNLERYPERVHQIAANQLSVEYTHLRILNEEESQAHLYGEIHIHGLEYFDQRPTSQNWDPRLILKYGLPPIQAYQECCKYNPAKNLDAAILHLAKWLGMTSQEFNELQGYNLINIFLAPYIIGLKREQIAPKIETLIYELNQLNLLTGRKIPMTYLSTLPRIINPLMKVPAIGPNGRELDTYEDYQEESLNLFNIISEVFKKGISNGKPFTNPKHVIFMDSLYYNNANDEAFEEIWEEIIGPHVPILINYRENDISTTNPFFSPSKTLYNQGILQKITLNLPRYAYISRDESEFFKVLKEKVKLSTDIFEKKREIIKKRLINKQLPLCSGEYETGKTIFNLNEQKSCIGFIGLNETVKILTGEELHESENAFQMGLNVIKTIDEYCHQLSSKKEHSLALFDCNSSKVRARFARLDLKHFSKKAKLIMKNSEPQYSASSKFKDHLAMNPELIIKKQGEFHEIIKNEGIEYLALKIIQNIPDKFRDLALTALNHSKLNAYTFY